MKNNNKKLQELITEMICAAHDADHVGERYAPNSLDDWKKVLSDLETVHYFCMDARRIVRRKIRSAQQCVEPTEGTLPVISSESVGGSH